MDSKSTDKKGKSIRDPTSQNAPNQQSIITSKVALYVQIKSRSHRSFDNRSGPYNSNSCIPRPLVGIHRRIFYLYVGVLESYSSSLRTAGPTCRPHSHQMCIYFRRHILPVHSCDVYPHSHRVQIKETPYPNLMT